MRTQTLLRIVMLTLALVTPAHAADVSTKADVAAQQAEVRATETAFAKSMADRDFAAFGKLIADEAIFFGRDGEMRGKKAVLDGWKPLFEGEKAPFSWAPKEVVVLDSGGLALSSGPVHAPDGKRVGTFMSVWRRESPGVWKIVFDKGCDPCPQCPTAP
ncbi:MAG TPA: nuclear transport factor 2 family protein [Nevskiaceae bacterium]|nr:nuclear transport factor 2 family protein [Nevskiaceae bacterium]